MYRAGYQKLVSLWYQPKAPVGSGIGKKYLSFGAAFRYQAALKQLSAYRHPQQTHAAHGSDPHTYFLFTEEAHVKLRVMRN